MKPSRHVIASFSIALILWFFTKSVYAAIICFASGVLVDTDHIIEYVIHHGWRGISLEKVYHTSEETAVKESASGFGRVYLIFHSGEIAILLWIATAFTKNVFLLAVALGYSSHLILDCIGNPMYPSSYFIISRGIKKFNPDKLFTSRNDNYRG